MSISPIGSKDIQRDDSQDVHPEPRPTSSNAIERPFDFSGAAYTAVHLPTALIASSSAPRPTVATITKDVSDLEAKVGKLRTDLASPGMRAWLDKHVAATKTGASLGFKIATITVTIVALKEKGLAGLFAAEGIMKALSAGDKVFGLVDDCKTFAKQIMDEHVAAKAAHPDVVRVEQDLIDVMAAGVKLHADLRKLAGT
ncbi:MAG TPA: hypothetical protein VGH87_18840 [Polyangiaceae bacterium]|jgi:hypothetical protein